MQWWVTCHFRQWGSFSEDPLIDPWSILEARTQGIYTLTPIPHLPRAAPRLALSTCQAYTYDQEDPGTCFLNENCPPKLHMTFQGGLKAHGGAPSHLPQLMKNLVAHQLKNSAWGRHHWWFSTCANPNCTTVNNLTDPSFCTCTCVVVVLVAPLCLTLCNPMDCSPPGSSVHAILQARILEWVAMHSSRESSWPRDQIQVPCIAGRFFTIWATSWIHHFAHVRVYPQAIYRSSFTKPFVILMETLKTGILWNCLSSEPLPISLTLLDLCQSVRRKNSIPYFKISFSSL